MNKIELYQLKCPQCNHETLRPFRIFSENDLNPAFIQKYCIKCKYPLSSSNRFIPLELPKIKKKKIIYLDQNIISEVMQAVCPLYSSSAKDITKKRGMEIFCKLDRLRISQCIVCPYSWDHRRESVLSGKIFKDLMKMYTYLANDVRFQETQYIETRQIYLFTKAWLKNDFSHLSFSDDNSVFESNPHSWYMRGVNEPYSYVILENEAEAVRNIHKLHHKNFLDIYNRWKDKEYTQIFEEELSGFGDWIKKFINKEKTLTLGEIQFFEKIVHNVHLACIEDGVMFSLDILVKILLSEELKIYYPFLRYSAAMNMYIAERVNSLKNPLTEKDLYGESTDVNRIASHAIYCDAIVTDKFFSSVFKEKKMNELTSNKCKFFDLKNYEKFLEYLDQIEDEYKDQIKMVESIFGSIEPKLDLYGNITTKN